MVTLETVRRFTDSAYAVLSLRMREGYRSDEVFEALLAGRDYLMGDEPGAADLAAFPFVKYASVEPDPADDELFHRMLAEHQQAGESHPRLAAWIERIDALPRARGATVAP